MQITIELTEEEYMQVESHTKRALLMSQIGMANLTIADKILGRLYMAAGKNAKQAQKESEPKEITQ